MIVGVIFVIVVLTNWHLSNQKLFIQQTAEKSVAGQLKRTVAAITDECNLKIASIEERSKQRYDNLSETVSSLRSKINANSVEIDTLEKSNRSLRQMRRPQQSANVAVCFL